MTSEQQINYSLSKGAAIKDKVRPGVTHSVNDCIMYLWYDVVKVICWDLNTAVSAGNTSTREMMYYTDLRLHCKCKCCYFLRRKIRNMTKEHRTAQVDLNDRLTIFHPRPY